MAFCFRSNFCYAEAKECVNCKVYGWKQPADTSDLKRCSSCKVVWYCGEQCQKEHWQKTHKNHCKYLAGRKVLPKSKHDEATCLVCQEEMEAKACSGCCWQCNPVLPCTLSVGNNLLSTNHCETIGQFSHIPLAEMTGQFHSKVEATLATMMRIMLKMKMTRHAMWNVEKETSDQLYQMLSELRVLFRKFSVVVGGPDGVQGDSFLCPELFEAMDKINLTIRDVDYHNDSQYMPWDTLKVLASFLLGAQEIIGRTAADLLGVPDLSETAQNMRVTVPKFFRLWENVLKLLSRNLVPISQLVEVLCDGNTTQECFGCSVQVSVENLVVNYFGELSAPPNTPILLFNYILLATSCGRRDCFNSAVTAKLKKTIDPIFVVYIQFSELYRNDICDYCGGFNKEVRGFRCAGCKTKLYCGMGCYEKDTVHHTLCEKGDGRKKKKGTDRRREEGKKRIESLPKPEDYL